MDDNVWVPTVFTKNRLRLIEHDAVVAFFNKVLVQAELRNWFSKEYFSVDGQLIQAWASHQSFVPEGECGADTDGDGGEGRDFQGSPRSNETIEQCCGWAKTISHVRQVMALGLKKVDEMFIREHGGLQPGAHALAGAGASAGESMRSKVRQTAPARDR